MATSISIADTSISNFWNSPWLLGCRLRDIGLEIFRMRKRKKWTISNALRDDVWTRQLNFASDLSVIHFSHFDLWSKLAPGYFSEQCSYRLHFLAVLLFKSLLILIGLLVVVCWCHFLSHKHLTLKRMGSTKMQDFFLDDHP